MGEPESGVHFGRELAITANQFRRVTDRIIERRVGLTAAQANTLHFIMLRSREGDVYQRDIERTFDLRSPSVTGMLKQLEAKGLIRREADAGDARMKRIVLTEEAAGIEDRIHACIFAMEEAVRGGLTEEEQQNLVRTLQKISETINRKDREEAERYARKD